MFRLDSIGIATKHYLNQQGIKKKIWKDKNLVDFSGRGLIDAGKSSVIFVRRKLWDVIKLREGKTFCRVVKSVRF